MNNKKAKILVIEDNQDVRENILEILELSSYEVLGAENGKAGVKAVKSFLPDIILCDVMMPELDGFGVLHILNKDPQTSIIPFIFLTAKTEKEDIRKGMGLGADDYLTKPFKDNELLEAIQMRLQKVQNLTLVFSSDHSPVSYLESGGKLILDHFNKIKEMSPKEYLYHQGDYAQNVYYIEKGQMRCTMTDNFGKELTTRVHVEGEFFGFLDALEGQERKENAISMAEIRLKVITADEFRTLLTSDRDLSNRLISWLTNNVRETEIRLLEMAYAPVRERVIKMLLELFSKNAETNTIEQSREDMASMVGTSTETLIRVLSELKKDKTIEVSGRKIHLLNKEALRN